MKAGVVLMLASVLSLSSCSKPQFYNFCVFNRTGAEIKTFTIDSNGDLYEFNSPELNGISFYDFAPLVGAMPSKVNCTWRDQAGRLHETVLSIPAPRKDQGDSTRACFFIFPDHTIKVATFSEIEMRDDAQVKNGFDIKFATNGGPLYEVNVLNRSGEVIRDIIIKFGKACVLKYPELSPYRKDHKLNKRLAPMNDLTEGLPYKITETADIEWEDEQGVKQHTLIPLKTILPLDLSGRTISFTIGKNEQVVLSTFPSDEHYSKWFDHNFLTDKGDLNK